MVVVDCPVDGCDYSTQDVSEALAIALLTIHGPTHTAHTPEPLPVKGPRLERPQVNVGISTEEWNVFIRRWEVFRVGSGIDDASAPSQLFQCAGTELGDSILKANPNATSGTLATLMNDMKSLAVIPIATGVLRTELLQMRQERDESFRAYAARVRGKAETCEFVTTCQCGANVNYTDHQIRDTLLNGINDHDIRRDILGHPNILQMPVNDVIAVVENKEMARNALPSSNLAAVSSFVRQRQSYSNQNATRPASIERKKTTNCPDCKRNFNMYNEGPKGWNIKPHQYCIDCYRARRKNRRQKPKSDGVINSIVADSVHQIANLSVTTKSPKPFAQIAANKEQSGILDHHTFTEGKWRKAKIRDHPQIPITITTSLSHSNPGNICGHIANVVAVADTGAQSDLWSLSDFLACGFTMDILRPVRLDLSAANTSSIVVEGAFFAKIETCLSDSTSTSCHSMIYVSSSVKSMFLSYETLLNLGLLPDDFPWTSNNHGDKTRKNPSPNVNVTRAFNDGCSDNQIHNSPCSCPQRLIAPQKPTELPFICKPENNYKMKDWLMKRYESSTFNTCPHRPLPCMDGPPVEIHVDPKAEPKACHKPANIPLHWQQRVYEDLLRDEALGVIERVPYGEPVTWCHRMVVTRKHNGNPRRTVDLSPLNKFCKRETFAAESPFQLARRIPKCTWKTVTDAWNGYHSVPLRPCDKHYTTFITPFGRWRYTRAPQGFVSSGDGYNRRFDAITSNFERKERCVDDTIHYDTDLEQHWWRTIDFLTCLGQAGIVLNPEKFQFAQKTVDFAGFRVSDLTIEPLPKYLDAIRDFPTPSSTTDIRSWFGLVNQVANYAQLRDTMTPFKPFLSPRKKFMWDDDLDRAFINSKEAIVNAIRHGVQIFDVNKRTCLRPDWSKKGIGYFLMQQCCTCPLGVPGCCDDGWQVTLAGSRFLSSAEERYAAVEGEALAVAWGLEQTRYFTQGCDNLIVVTDHKPLVKILGDRTLDEITNSRLFRIKQRTLPWRFEIEHLPGKSNLAADATSRNPSSSGAANNVSLNTNQDDMLEGAIMSSIVDEITDTFSLSWSLIAAETAADESLCHLIKLIEQGFSEDDKRDKTVASIWQIKDSFYVQEGVILYQDRIFVPQKLRHALLKTLHAAHQGISAMEQRARAIVYWPGLSADIQRLRETCFDCNRNAPSQAATPPILSDAPSTPFESIFADFFDYGGRHYLVIGDRLSGWVEVYASPTNTHFSGAAGLIKHLRSLFATFGVPEELSSDGGPEFSAGSTQEFLNRWGVRHRLSSAYFPQSNGRAEVAVKKAKRLLLSTISPSGSLDNDKFLRAMLQLRNTPDPDCNVSPAQILFGRQIRDVFSFANRLEKFTNHNIRPMWRQAWAAKEDALRTRMTRTSEKLELHSRQLRPLIPREKVFLQNQSGPHSTKWDKTGVIVEVLPHDQYLVRVDGSGRLTRRNRRFLRAYTPVQTSIRECSTPSLPPDVDTHGLAPRSSPAKATPTIPAGNNLYAEGDAAPEVEELVPPPTLSSASQDRDTTHRVDFPDKTLSSDRPRRLRTRPKIYEPESGLWVTR